MIATAKQRREPFYSPSQQGIGLDCKEG